MNLSRREFLGLGAGAVASTVFPIPLFRGKSVEKLKFGLITDVHQDIMHDGVERLSAFVEAMKKEEGLDFVMQMGDFCTPAEENRRFIEVWNKISYTKYHVLGNHDTDGGFSQAQTMAFWGMKERYYSFDLKGVRFVVLDANEKGGARAGYPIYVGEEQVAWFRRQLESSPGPVVVVSHQPFEHENGIENGAELRSIVQESRKVVACLNGHDHTDYAVAHDRTWYMCVNSASYHWLGSAGQAGSYPEHILAAHPAIRSTAPYRDPLWAVVTLDLEALEMRVEGRMSEWVGDDPWARGVEVSREKVRPGVSDRRLPVGDG